MSAPRQKLRGLVGQGMDGRRPTKVAYSRTFPPRVTSYLWAVPQNGIYEIAAWGCGSVTSAGTTGTGAFAFRRLALNVGQWLTITVGLNGQLINPAGGSTGVAPNTTISFPDGTNMVAGACSAGGVPGIATGGDVTP